jgi:HEAT repeat protein
MRILTTWLLTLIVATPALAAENAPVADLIAKLPSSPPETWKPIVRQLAAAGEPALTEIIDQLKEPGKGDDRNPRYALHALAIYAGSPGCDDYRHVFANTLRRALASERPAVVKVLLIEQSVFAGESITGSTHGVLLDDRLSSHAARAAIAVNDERAQRLVADAAGDVSASEPFRVGTADVILAAGVFKQTHILGEFLSRGDFAIRITARRAMAVDAKPEYVAVILKDIDAQDPFEQRQSIDAALLLARRLTESGHRPDAEKIYRTLMQKFPDATQVQCAALQGLAQTDPNEKTLELILQAVHSEHLDLQAAAMDAGRSLPGRYVTRAWLKEIDKVSPEVGARILELLAQRGDPDAFDGVLTLTKHNDPTIRRAAILTAATLGGERAIPALIDLLKSDPDRLAAERALAKAPGKPATTAIAYAIPEATPPAAKAALLNVLAARNASGQIDFAIHALKDESPQVRAAAVTALGTLGAAETVPTLIAFLTTAKTDTDRAAAETSILALSRLTPNGDKRIAPIAGALPTTTDLPNRAALLRILGKLGGPAALDPLLQSIKDPNPDIQDAAVRALANYPAPDDQALATLLDLARNSQNNTHRTLALRAYIRLAGQRQLPADQRLDMYRQSLALSKTADDKKLALAGLSDLGDSRALPLLTPLLDDPETQQESAAAIVRVTRDTRAPNDEVRAILEKVVQIARDERIKHDAARKVETLGGKPDK